MCLTKLNKIPVKIYLTECMTQKLEAAFLVAEAFLLPNQPYYTSNETGAGALFQYLNTLAPLKAPCWGLSANSSATPHYHLLANVPPPLFFQRDRSCWHVPPL